MRRRRDECHRFGVQCLSKSVVCRAGSRLMWRVDTVDFSFPAMATYCFSTALFSVSTDTDGEKVLLDSLQQYRLQGKTYPLLPPMALLASCGLLASSALIAPRALTTV